MIRVTIVKHQCVFRALTRAPATETSMPSNRIPELPQVVDIATRKSVPPPTRTSRDLLGDGDRLLIEHGGETYVLRLTRQGKLILTK
jgi:hemin uptake protein HemP